MEKAKEIISEYMPVFIMGSTELIKDYDLYRRFVKSYETVPEVSIDAESLLNEIRELAGVDQTGVCIEHEIEYKLGDSLCRMISEFDVSDRNELRKQDLEGLK